MSTIVNLHPSRVTEIPAPNRIVAVDRFEDRACSACKRPNVATIGLQVCDCL